ncbi:trypsin 3A1-like [Babylonia areolata]|uniref:trypsin 3A1-like n=1 Tax=Babylonia areolata TaxID=304850 RepID=UPI003FD4B853
MLSLPLIFAEVLPVAYFSPLPWCAAEDAVLGDPGGDRSARQLRRCTRVWRLEPTRESFRRWMRTSDARLLPKEHSCQTSKRGCPTSQQCLLSETIVSSLQLSDARQRENRRVQSVKMRLLILAVVVALAHARPSMEDLTCGNSHKLERHRSYGSRIVGGWKVDDCDTVPWQVGLHINRSSLCGGSIISKRHILTAAHCLGPDITPDLVKVYVGNKHILGGKSVKVQRITVHEAYNGATKENDIAMFTLGESIPFGRCARKICLTPNFFPENVTCTVSGWGTTAWQGDVSDVLKMTHVPTFHDNCKDAYKIPYANYPSNQNVMICAGFPDGRTDSCQGDSGGPLVCWDKEHNHFVQVGVVSYGAQCATELPGIYTKVSAYMDWIEWAMSLPFH